MNRTFHTQSDRFSIPTTAVQHYTTTVYDGDLPGRADIYITDLYELYDLYDMYDLYELAHVAGWEPYILQYLRHVSWVRFVLHRSCTTYHNDRLGSRSVDGDLSDL